MIKLQKTQENRKVERHNDLLLITGDGRSLPDDLNRFKDKRLPHDVMCVGRSIKLIRGKVLHYVDVDADSDKWVLENLDKNHPDAGYPITHTMGNVDWVDVGWDSDDIPYDPDDVRWHGSTALFGCLIAREMGYRFVVLAGCPMDKEGHWYFPAEHKGPNWQYQDLAAWVHFKGNGAKHVTSMSGLTRMILGGPPWDL